MEPAGSYPRLMPAGDTGLVVELGDGVSLAVNRRVRALDRLVAAARIPGVVETQPTNRSLFILYEPLTLAYDALCAAVERLLAALPEMPDESGGRSWIIPAVYGGEYGIDLGLAAARLGLDPGALVARHAARTYNVFMIGFQPGFSYLGELDPALAVSRHGEPRPLVPAGTVSIAGVQTVINSVAAPSGWMLIARTPVRLFDPARARPFLLAPGDRVRFQPMAAAAWEALEARAADGELLAEREP